MSRIEAALDALRAGKPVLVSDAADRENEGDVILSAQHATPEWIAWTVRHTSGLLCAPMTGARADALDLPAMVADNQDPKQTAYTVTVDAARGVTTGISAADRATTLRVLADPTATSRDLIRPGHILPLRARPGGVLERPGHTEAAVDLCALAGLPQVGVIAELVSDDGSMMRMPEIEALGAQYDLPVLTIEELIRYRAAHPFPSPVVPSGRVVRADEASMPTRFGTFRAVGYLDRHTGADHMALIAGPLGDAPLVRVHSECLTGESFASQRCECGPQLDTALERIAQEGGVLVYLRGHEGRGIGLLKKLAAYRLQDGGFDTVAANLELDEPADGREYGGAAAILHDLGIGSVLLLTNNPAKIAGLEDNGIVVAGREPLHVGVAPANVRYLETKRRRMGHMLPAAQN
ncbi:bifunctional 3,4-dihydroxy-2-butanone-4-phosphate synthase/GTP cyclohydrolase II [Rhodococcus pyridinivorans]|uniref:Multifunctional fusion protein n=1 Tax=Rhodococcus pyridinivorans AK37 TaxID=1114960 RepID=H0JT99_9NOCA|nr:bifunctional 3,4-dihydroxy-2-butanone-4-phosphate synthase/GTP cyclohydrolase II [Rhodococcus pyridinivorans]EHK82776.1 GTP cyclohydrolase II [Rhodococcus pyridinivorans AK37]MCD2141038.1 bifunctional 3,4-dihydroxy-2-butanone-4-phosphate synthase/GTP cyclohydrolase II [Rhodococcus pyridinivorans]